MRPRLVGAQLIHVTCCALLLLAARATAQPDPRSPSAAGIPRELQPWTAWVLSQDETLACPVRDGAALCFWPGPLELELDQDGGRFAIDVLADARLTMGLPGGPARWPLAVRVDGKPAPVIARGAQPALQLEPGKHRVEGRYSWPHLPESLPLPASYGRVDLRVRGKVIERPKRDEAGSLWLQGETEPEQEAQLELIVQRKIQDGVPMRVETRIRIRAAGQAREVDLGQVLLAGSVPMSLQSDLPVRLDATGNLRLQVRAGSFQVQVLARVSGAPAQLASVKRSPPWPPEEAWVFEADEALRQVKLAGARSVDATRLDLDPDWRGLPAYLLAQGEALSFTTTRRGDPDPVPNQLQLRRSLWLDQDGRGYSVHDQITGDMHSGFRLDLRGFDLGRVAVGERDQLITRRGAKGPTGVELRDTKLELAADWRAENLLQSLPAVAWSEDMRSLAITLNMPPGYSLFGVRGVDRVDRSWLQDWDLLGFFFVLLLALGTARVAGIWFGLLAFVALGISYQEPDAPTAIWIALLVLVALLRVVPNGKARSIVRGLFWVSVLVFAVQVAPFATRSLREAIYPQLGAHRYAPAVNAFERSSAREEAKPAAPPPAAEPAQDKGGLAALTVGALGGMASQSALSNAATAYGGAATKTRGAAKTEDPDAVVQTGPGLPDWTWQSWELSWSGPVQRDHHFELLIMPPRLTRTLAVLRVVLCALLAYGLFAAGSRRPRPSQRPPTGVRMPTGVALTLLLSLLGSRARAQFPDRELLQELRARLTRAPECRPNCVAVSELELSVGAEGLGLRSEVHAQDRTSVRIAGPASVWVPASLRVDGAEAHMVVLDDGFLHVRLLPGVHTVEARGPLPSQDTLTLRLGDAPAHIRVQRKGYEVTGVRDDGTADESLELRRTLRATTTANQQSESSSLPPWLTLTRELDLGIEFRVHTTLKRQTPIGTAVVVHVPLLEGESVNDSRLQVDGREAIATLGPDEAEFTFDSGLMQRTDINLVANAVGPYSELWRVRCGQVWQCTTELMVPVARTEHGQAVTLFRPWPNERLRVRIDKPKPAEGQSTTIDSARWRLQPGIRQTDATLQISMRTSRGGVHSVRLPERARVRSLSIEGVPRPVHNAGRKLAFTLLPGSSTIVIALELPLGMTGFFRVPEVRLDTRVVNARTELVLPPDTWLLWLRGPAWGPAILFWGYLVFAIFLAVLLARAGTTPLKLHEWVLLAFGLTQIDVFEALLVIGFFFLFALRARTTKLGPWRHNLMQLALVAVALAAAGALFDAVQHGLLVQPDMQVSGAGSAGGQLEWYADRTDGTLPTPSVITAPLWVYRALMLLWSLWLASRLLRWLPWAFRAFVSGSAWKRGPKRRAPPPPWAAGPPAPPADAG
jgi:hypothetical protein